MAHRLSIKSKTHRGVLGFLIFGSTEDGQRWRVFCETRPEAERIRDAIEAGRSTVEKVTP
jgi:hypothetical protein